MFLLVRAAQNCLQGVLFPLTSNVKYVHILLFFPSVYNLLRFNEKGRSCTVSWGEIKCVHLTLLHKEISSDSTQCN